MGKKILNNRGIALITVILIVSVLIAFAIELNRSTRADIYDAANVSDGIKLTYIAKSGVYGALAVLDSSKNEYVSLLDEWANMETLSVQSKDLFEGGYFIVRVEDESGKIPLNKLAENKIYDILVTLLKLPEFGLDAAKADEIVASIKDWIDADSDVTSGGAESSYYLALDPPYRAKNKPLDCIEELLMIKGVTKEIFAGTLEKPGLAQYVTVVGDGTININTAPVMVLRALLSDDVELAKEMDEYRRNKDNNDALGSNWYTSYEESLGNIAKVNSNFFKIISSGKMDDMEQTITAILNKSDKKILQWRVD
ncbi:MAG: type II secretion system minor pseudopilin GspK [Syntrophaceae bacterium]|nr:type II secretion system minor pseudopilin GspK [Syntrophaceae bacterium]